MTTPPNTTNTPPQEESHEAKMIRKFYTADPSQIPEQFEGDVEKAVEGYKQLQAKFTKASQELAAVKKAAETPPEPKPEEKPTAPPAPLKIEDAPVEETPAVSWESIEEEFATTGTVSEDSIVKLTAMLKLPSRNFIDAHVAYMKDKREQAHKQAQDIAGGVENYNKVLAWAAKALSQAEKAALNASLNSPGWELAWTGLVTKFNKVNTDGANPRPNAPVATGGGDEVLPWGSQAEMTAAIRDPRYRLDPAYQAMVMKRSAKTAEIGYKS